MSGSPVGRGASHAKGSPPQACLAEDGACGDGLHGPVAMLSCDRGEPDDGVGGSEGEEADGLRGEAQAAPGTAESDASVAFALEHHGHW
jgi:hypothetical protein